MYVLAIQAQTQLYSYYFHSSLLVSLFLKEILMHATQYNNYSEFGVKIEKKGTPWQNQTLVLHLFLCMLHS